MSKLNIKLALSGAALLTLAACVPIDPSVYDSYNRPSESPTYHNPPPYREPVYREPSYRTPTRLNRIPSNYRSDYYNGQRYYTYNGVYYERRNGAYYRVDNPRRSRNNNYDGPRRPDTSSRKYTPVRVNGRTYYKHSRDWYVRSPGTGYIRVSDPRKHYDKHGNSKYKPVSVNGKRFYEEGGRYYVKRGNTYVRVGNPNKYHKSKKYKPVTINGRQYFKDDGNYFIYRNGAYIRTKIPRR